VPPAILLLLCLRGRVGPRRPTPDDRPAPGCRCGQTSGDRPPRGSTSSRQVPGRDRTACGRIADAHLEDGTWPWLLGESRDVGLGRRGGRRAAGGVLRANARRSAGPGLSAPSPTATRCRSRPSRGLDDPTGGPDRPPPPRIKVRGRHLGQGPDLGGGRGRVHEPRRRPWRDMAQPGPEGGRAWAPPRGGPRRGVPALVGPGGLGRAGLTPEPGSLRGVRAARFRTFPEAGTSVACGAVKPLSAAAAWHGARPDRRSGWTPHRERACARQGGATATSHGQGRRR
jgi:hypothetical protein